MEIFPLETRVFTAWLIPKRKEETKVTVFFSYVFQQQPGAEEAEEASRVAGGSIRLGSSARRDR
jgi:hypothetical protein